MTIGDRTGDRRPLALEAEWIEGQRFGAPGRDREPLPALTLVGSGDAPQVKVRRAVSEIISWRRRRARFFPGDLFSDPVWDMLLDLAIARLDGRPLQISYVGIEAGVSSSTSLRWIKYLVARGLVRRWRDPLDKRRELVELSDDGLAAFAGYVDGSGGQGFVIG